MTWSHPTLADLGVTERQRCPGPERIPCGRRRWPSEMYDVRGIGVGRSHLCSACVETLYRKEIVDRLTVPRRAGAPPEALAEHRAVLKQGPLDRPGLGQELWGEMLAERIDAGLPVDQRWEAKAEARAAKSDQKV